MHMQICKQTQIPTCILFCTGLHGVLHEVLHSDVVLIQKTQGIRRMSLMFADAKFFCVLKKIYICVLSSHNDARVVRNLIMCCDIFCRALKLIHVNLYFELCIEYFVCRLQVLFVYSYYLSCIAHRGHCILVFQYFEKQIQMHLKLKL